LTEFFTGVHVIVYGRMESGLQLFDGTAVEMPVSNILLDTVKSFLRYLSDVA
jgi:hypothetical protein